MACNVAQRSVDGK